LKKRILLLLLAGGICTLVFALAFVLISPVRADCGSQPPSSCLTCHEQEDPVSNKGEWHIVHAAKDLCVDCHGGNASSMNKDTAHETLVAQPLSDIYTGCHSCHTDYETRADIFAAYLGVTPESCATSTPIPFVNIPQQPPSQGDLFSTSINTGSSTSHPFWIAAGMISGLLLFVFGVIWLERNKMHS
jgi:hypothetical protein